MVVQLSGEMDQTELESVRKLWEIIGCYSLIEKDRKRGNELD